MKLWTFAVAACALAVVQVIAQGPLKSSIRSVAEKRAPVKGQMAGGTNITARGQYPWLASIYADGGYVCMGSWISYTFVLTAASCVSGRTNLTIRMGMNRMLNDVFEEGSHQYDTVTKFIHPNYNATYLTNNIALVKYNNVVGNSWVVNTVGLPRLSDANNTFEGIVATLTGWGASYIGGPYIQDKQAANLTIVANCACATIFGTNYVTPAVLCTKSPTNSNGACTSDQGSPLAYQDASGNWVLLGVMSFVGPNCTTLPQGFTRVTSHLGWISSMIPGLISP